MIHERMIHECMNTPSSSIMAYLDDSNADTGSQVTLSDSLLPTQTRQVARRKRLSGVPEPARSRP